MSKIKFTLAQINPTVGDIVGNCEKIISKCVFARDECDADVVVFPELAVCGYPPEDLLLRRDFLERCDVALDEIRGEADGITVLIGHPLLHDKKVYNALSVLHDGAVRCVYRKRCLPNYAVFDEKRYFSAGDAASVVEIAGVQVGLTVCEDIWEASPVRESVAAGAQLIVSVNASPFHNEQAFLREQGVVVKRAREFNVPMIYLNQVGGQDELVFDGSSLAVNSDGEIATRLPAFCECAETVVFDGEKFSIGSVAPRLQGAELIYNAIVLGVRDYIEKNNFAGAVIGLSGGVDSALTLAIAVDAIGASRVVAVMMPSRYTSEMSKQDARAEADALGVRFESIDIEPMVAATSAQLQPLFGDRAADATEENIQSRCRGLLLMALSNKLGLMVLTTGNKSEMAVGYATLYGDMVGGFSAIKDVPKMLVYELARYRNGIAKVIPDNVLTRAPTAELAADQKDEDSLPAYEILDGILEAYVERDQSAKEIIAAGFDAQVVHRVIKMVTANEYKRRQAAPGVRVTSRAFGKDRRYPITSGF